MRLIRFVRAFGIRGYLLPISLILAVTITQTGCAAGNYGLLRTVANWNLRFSIIPRILIYIAFVIVPIYPLAALFDLLINNTIEFWTKNPIVRAGIEVYERDGQRLVVEHRLDPRRISTFRIFAANGELISTTQWQEREDQSIEVIVEGRTVAQLRSIGDAFALLTQGSETRALTFSPTELRLPLRDFRKKLDPRSDNAVANAAWRRPSIIN